MKIALFRDNAFGYTSPWNMPEGTTDSDYCPDGYLRTSEWVEVEFPARDPDELIPAQLRVLDARKAAEVDRHLAALAELDEERSKILALTHQTEAA